MQLLPQMRRRGNMNVTFSDSPMVAAPSGLCSLVCHRPHHFLGTSRHGFITSALDKRLRECTEIVVHTSSVLSHTPAGHPTLDAAVTATWLPSTQCCSSRSVASPLSWLLGPGTWVPFLIAFFLLLPHPAHQMVSPFTSLQNIF